LGPRSHMLRCVCRLHLSVVSLMWAEEGNPFLQTRPLALAKDAAGRYTLQPQEGPSIARAARPLVMRPLPGSSVEAADVSQMQHWRHSQRPVQAPSGRSVVVRPIAMHERALDGAEKAHLRGKLLTLGSSFVEFDRRVEEEASQRRELEERKISDITMTLSQLEDGLAKEVAQREEDRRGLERLVDTMLEQMVGHVQAAVQDRFVRLSHATETLCERCSTLERGIQQFRGDVPSKLKVEAAALRGSIRRLTLEMREDCRTRAEEDTRLSKAIEASEREAEARLQHELAQWERQREAVQEVIDEFASADRPEERARHQSLAEGAIANLEAEIHAETVTRERADDQVVQAINEYTSLLHRSLRVTTA